jgi:hypothetical protein
MGGVAPTPIFASSIPLRRRRSGAFTLDRAPRHYTVFGTGTLVELLKQRSLGILTRDGLQKSGVRAGKFRA